MASGFAGHTRRALTSKLIAAAAAAALPGTVGGAPRDQPVESVKIVSALPLTGPSYGEAISVVHGIRLAIEEAGRRAGPFLVEYEAWDDATAATGDWDPEKTAELAQHAAFDPDVVVYIGHFASEATAIALPILNSQGLVVVNPTNSYPGLTKTAGALPGEPGVYYPAGVRSFVRVLPADDAQGTAGASWAKTLGAATAYVIDDAARYGRPIADAFVAACPGLGIRVLGRGSIIPGAADHRSLAATIRTANPDVVYFGGAAASAAGQLARDLRTAGAGKHLVGPDGIRNGQFLADAGAAAEGVWATSGAVSPPAFRGPQLDWKMRFETFSGASPELYALYAYEAARVALDAIARAGVKDRNLIRDAVFATRDFQGLLGRWGFDGNGDTTDTTVTVSRASRSGDTFEWVLHEVVGASA